MLGAMEEKLTSYYIIISMTSHSLPFFKSLIETSVYASYPMGDGELFYQWIKANHIGKFLFHIEDSSDS